MNRSASLSSTSDAVSREVSCQSRKVAWTAPSSCAASAASSSSSLPSHDLFSSFSYVSRPSTNRRRGSSTHRLRTSASRADRSRANACCISARVCASSGTPSGGTGGSSCRADVSAFVRSSRRRRTASRTPRSSSAFLAFRSCDDHTIRSVAP